jgi:hypothetical protein
LRDDRASATGVAVAEAVHTASHGRWPSRLQGEWSGHARLEVGCRTLLARDRGCPLRDDPARPKPLAAASGNLAWGSSRQEHTPVSGRSLVPRGWPDGRLRMPSGVRPWHKGGPSTHALAWEVLRDARQCRRWRPGDGLFDAWPPSTGLRKRMRDDSRCWVCRPKTDRRVNGAAVRADRRHPYRAAPGRLTGGLTGAVVRDGATDDATHRVPVSAAGGRRLSRFRPQSEAAIRVWKAHVSLRGGQARSRRAQLPHITGGLAAVWGPERERHDRGLRMYKRRRARSGNGQSTTLPALDRLRRTA